MTCLSAAESAALSEKKSFEHFSSQSAVSPEDICIARRRASISHSHTIYAAVIDHEAFCVKVALSVANDVKFWNLHQKWETLKICIDAAESQRNKRSNPSEYERAKILKIHSRKMNVGPDVVKKK